MCVATLFCILNLVLDKSIRLKTLRAVDPKRTWEISPKRYLNQTENKEFVKYAKKTEKTVRREFSQAYRNKEITKQEYEANYHHEIWKRVGESEKYKDLYKYTKINE